MSSSNKTGQFTTTFAELSKFFEVLSFVVCECRLRITETKVSAICVDTANVVLVNAVLNGIKSSVIEGEEVSLGLDVSAMSTAFRGFQQIQSFDQESEVTLSWTPGKEHPRIYLEVLSIGFKSRFNSFDVNTIKKDPNKPKVTFTSKATIDGEVFKDAMLLCSKYSDRVRIETSKNGCFIASNSDDRECRIRIAATDMKGGAVSLYSLDYFKDIAKVLIGSQATFELSTDHPVSISFNPTQNLSVNYMLAPRIGDNDVGKWMI